MNNVREPRCRRAWSLLTLLSLSIAALGCGDDDSPVAAEPMRDSGATKGDAEVPIPAACTESSLGVLRLAPWPGGGLQLALSASDADGQARTDLQASDFSLETQAGEAIPLELRAQPQEAGLTALLIVPSDDRDEHASRLRAAQALIEALPAQERIALFVLAPDLPMASELSDRHEHVLARLHAIESAAPADEEALLASGLEQVSARLASVAQPWGSLARTVVVVGAELPGAFEHQADAGDVSAHAALREVSRGARRRCRRLGRRGCGGVARRAHRRAAGGHGAARGVRTVRVRRDAVAAARRRALHAPSTRCDRRARRP